MGAMKCHRLISSLEYLSQETSQRQTSGRDEQSTQQASCPRHGEPFCLYCVRCRLVICMGCVVDHPEHAVRDIPSAAQNAKETQELHTQEVERVYCAALEALQAWKQQSLDGIKTRYSQWSVECSAILKHFQLQAQEMERMVQASKDLLASKDVEFLQGSTDFTKTIDDQLNEIRADLEKHEVSRQKLLDSVQHDHVVPRQVTVKETVEEHQVLEAAVGGQPICVTKPTLRFTETDDSELRITDSGCVVKGEGLSRELRWRRAVTDGRYQTGRYYWEIHITCSPGCSCLVGVTQESCDVSEETKPGRNSWYIVMVYRGDEVRCCSHRGGGEIKPGYLQVRPYTRPHHLGVYLDCDDHTLTVLDCDNNQVMYTVSDVIVTEPLVPSVEFCVLSGPVSVSARLVTGDSATLPQVLRDMISTS
ncbi:E3 ubiquitin-protein ligase TRIM39-like [Liolophura sinensis]|uniref:E3 ubiquitin-protein ligase TRIM39-like n=1 Tax=Liolophura sinensis TaxID=3198878 RepID=UPI0031592E2E